MSDYYALIPAGGVGNRFGSKLPKQYLQIQNIPLICYILNTLLSYNKFNKIFLVIAPNDHFWTDLNCKSYLNQAFIHKLEILKCGGETRADSVLNGLEAIQNQVHSDDWICVHDCARICLTHESLDNLVNSLNKEDIGGILALPVADTLKKQNPTSNLIQNTVSRDGLHQAQTPQQFRYELLLKALQYQKEQKIIGTDEAQAVELLGYFPKLIQGDLFNFKLTYPEDLTRCEQILKLQGKLNDE